MEKGKDVMMQGLQAKFKQNQALADTLKATRLFTIVECNAFDRTGGMVGFMSNSLMTAPLGKIKICSAHAWKKSEMNSIFQMSKFV